MLRITKDIPALGLPKYAEIVQDISCCGLDLWLEKVCEVCRHPRSHLR
jgi:hypothetical protein